jgi:hypothetical protein
MIKFLVWWRRFRFLESQAFTAVEWVSEKLLKCPGCGFNNRPKDVKCLFCGTALQADAPAATTPVVDAEATHVPGTAPEVTPEPATTPEGNRSTQRFNPTNLLLGDQSSEKTPTLDADPTEENVTDTQTVSSTPSPFILPETPTRDSSKEKTVLPKRGSTAAFRAAADGTLLFWIFCDPLEPIPLGYSQEVTAGRHHQNDLVLPHNEVSRFHARFKVSGRAVTLEDLGSSNGVIVNGIRRPQTMIAVGDRITIGPYELKIKDRNEYVQWSSDEDSLNKTRTSPAFNAFCEENVALSGNLQDTPLAEILQGFEFNQKTGTLVIIHRNIFGWVGVKNGQPHSAGFENKSGSEAIFEMLAFEEGHFTFYNTEPEGERMLPGTITGILLDYSRQIDESLGDEADEDFMLPGE